MCTNNLHLIITKETSSIMLVGDFITVSSERNVEMYSEPDDGAQMKLICMPNIQGVSHRAGQGYSLQ